MNIRLASAALLALVSAVVPAATGCDNRVYDENGTLIGADAWKETVACETARRSCEPAEGSIYSGVQYCTENDEGEDVWTDCCYYEVADCECMPPWEDPSAWECYTPLVFAFQNETVEYTTEVRGSFDLTGAGMSLATDWPTAKTPWLALDRDGNGSIDGGFELFGSATRLSTGSLAPEGFTALADLDDNADGTIDAKDAAFSRLVLWRDADASRTSEPSELSPASAELTGIDLRFTVDRRCDARGNCESERAAFRFVDGSGQARTGTVIDIHLRRQ